MARRVVEGSNSDAAAILKESIDRIMSLAEEKQDLADEQKEIMATLKVEGFDMKVVREIIKRRKMNPQERAEFDNLIETYEEALG